MLLVSGEVLTRINVNIFNVFYYKFVVVVVVLKESNCGSKSRLLVEIKDFVCTTSITYFMNTLVINSNLICT